MGIVRVAVMAPLAAAMLLAGSVLGASAQALVSGGPVDPALIDDLVAANRILADQGVLDAYGHVSIRHPSNPNRYLISRAMSPADVTAADIMELDLDSNPVDRRGRSMFLERFIHG
jgi:HCOMODA/2-hydroxy-3-carboxy-muconic semialdehyde decarboxylase